MREPAVSFGVGGDLSDGTGLGPNASFRHIIVVVQENRTPDKMFQGLCTMPSACRTQPGPRLAVRDLGAADKIDASVKSTLSGSPEAAGAASKALYEQPLAPFAAELSGLKRLMSPPTDR